MLSSQKAILLTQTRKSAMWVLCVQLRIVAMVRGAALIRRQSVAQTSRHVVPKAPHARTPAHILQRVLGLLPTRLRDFQFVSQAHHYQ